MNLTQKVDKSKVSGRRAHYSQEAKSRDQATGQFTHKFDEPLSKKAYATRLPVSVADKLDRLDDKGEWMREVLVEASKALE